MEDDMKSIRPIPFNSPSCDQVEINYVIEAMVSHHRHGDGQFTKRSTSKLRAMTGAEKILLTHSCTGALELAVLLADIRPGDEVIMPSYTFSSTANAVVLRGGVPVFADIDFHTQCIDPISILPLITPKTKAIIVVHYAGMACDMASISAIASEHRLLVIEDAAQAVGSFSHGRALGCFGELGALSFHDSKNISSGEGGALLINHEKFRSRAEIIWEKGTNRSQFMRGEVDKYTWADVGSSFLPSEVTAAFLLGQLERSSEINEARLKVWHRYFEAFTEAEMREVCMRPCVPVGCQHNGHMFYLILPSQEVRNNFLDAMKRQGVSATFHYVPLHDSPAGKRFGRAPLPMPNTMRAGQCLVRLPLFPGLTEEQQNRVIDVANRCMLGQWQGSHHAINA